MDSCRPSSRGAASIIVRGPNDSYCEEMERALHDALCAVKRTIEGGAVVAGGGAVETALSIWLEDYANTIVSNITILSHISCITNTVPIF